MRGSAALSYNLVAFTKLDCDKEQRFLMMLSQAPRTSDPKKTIQVVVPLELYERVQRAATTERRSLSSFVMNLLDRSVGSIEEDDEQYSTEVA